MSWTDERVELLKKMWLEGRSASQIAKELGAVTRNAVIGKVHRLGLSSRNADGAPSEPAAAESAPAVAAAPVAEAETPAASATAPETPATPAPEAEAPPAPATADDTEAAEEDDEPAVTGQVVHLPGRRPFATAGQPLPPQPSANEISPEALANVREIEKGARKLTLMELTERTCKWPIGDPATEEFWFCGLPVKPGKPYCEAHVSVAFQPMQSRRDRRR
ncbi:MAG: GcrA family cell cycle regulator [Pararhodobacter sp.]